MKKSLFLFFGLPVLLAGCFEDSVLLPSETRQNEVRQLAADKGLTGQPSPHFQQILPDNDPLVKLGQLLFFSRTLSGNQDTACASCHHPDFAMGDGLSLSVGVAAMAPWRLGPGRMINPGLDLDPRADGGPNVPRNSQSVLNVALYNRALFEDGRLFVLDEDVVPGGASQQIRTPESGNLPHNADGDTMLEIQVLFPLDSDREMRGFKHPELSANAYRQMLVERIRNADTGPGASWDVRFADAFPGESEPVTIGNIQRALAAYQASLIFVDSPWQRFLQEQASLSAQALDGASLFLKDSEAGGLGCVNCHAGDRLTHEGFYNAGFPQIGRGRLQGGKDSGRGGVTQKPDDFFRFRVPSLLNVAIKAPYGHAGSLQTLEDTIAWHVDPQYWVNQIEPVLQSLPQFADDNVMTMYPSAYQLTLDAINHASFQQTLELLPGRALTASETSALTAFLNSLTDNCASHPACMGQWTPEKTEDPDGSMLVRDEEFMVGEPPPPYPDQISFVVLARDSRSTFPELHECSNGMQSASNTGEALFVQRSDLGLDAPHGFSSEQWLADGDIGIEIRLFTGGITAAYLTGSCWPDLAYTGGEFSGLVLYENQQGQSFQDNTVLLDGAADDYALHNGVAVMDLTGDYYHELLLGNISPGDGVAVLAQNAMGSYQQMAELPMSRSTWGMSFSDFSGNGYPGMYMAHWSGGADGYAPALWDNDGTSLIPADKFGGTASDVLDQNFNFSPIFADMTGNGFQDLLIASDFLTSSTLRHLGVGASDPYFVNETDRSVITDQNGMGAVAADFFNRGVLDWFVTSIYDSSGEPNGNWGASGNRFYKNISTSEQMAFEDITEETGVRQGGWGWGTCAADFNNNGFLDIFHVGGFGKLPPDVDGAGLFADLTADQFHDNRPLLFINNGDGSFTEKSLDWGLTTGSQGTGVVCFDYDRDGDIDVALVDNSTGIQFYENRIGHGEGHRFLNIRLVGEAPNTWALGARVYAEADVGNGHGIQQQMRESMAHSSFNAQDLPDMHFGLGHADTATLTIVWPDSQTLVCEDVAVNQFLVIDQRDMSCP